MKAISRLDDILLNSLCEFDLAYCIIVFGKGIHHAEAYPSSAAFAESRSRPMALRIVDDAEIRSRLIPDASDADIAHALRETYHHADVESLKYGGSWGGPPPSVDQFIDHYDTGST